MKKLRLFDSLKFVLATVACMFILNVAHAATTAIQSVIAYGKTEQNGTPTPTNPVPIMTNNGELRVSRNLFDKAQTPYQSGNYISSAAVGQTGLSVTSNANYNVYRIKVQPNTTYTFGKIKANQPYWVVADSSNKVLQAAPNNGGTVGVDITITTDASAAYLYLSVGVNGTYKCDDILQLEFGSTATAYEPYREGGIYANGLTETIRDSAGHTATAQMLLSVGDYKDEQNITTGAITRRVGVKVFDGTENWSNGGAQNGYTRFVSRNIDDKKFGFFVLSNMFKSKKTSAVWSDETEALISGNNNTNNLYLSFPVSLLNCESNAECTIAFKAWLAEQYAAGTPVIVVYPLATETTENVTTQSLTTAPVRQTAGSILGMPIEVVLGDGTREWVRDMITIATTKYNEQQFAPVETRLDAAVAAVDTVVSQTMSQAQQIDQIATNKQTRPDEGCTAKYCLLVEDEDGTPHWYPIAGANGVEYVLPSGYTQLEYIQSDGASYLIVPYRVNNKTVFYARYNQMQKGTNVASVIFGVTTAATVSQANYGILRLLNGTSNFNRMGWGNNVSGSVIDVNAPQNLNTWYEVLYDQNKLYQDNVLYATSATSNDTEWVANYDLGIFARNGTAGVSYPAIAKISSVWAKEDGVYKINLIPARRNSDNVVGMYDMVSGQFFTNQGTGVFGEGPVVE